MNLDFIRNLPRNAQSGYRWLGLVSLAAGLAAWWAVARFGGLPAFVLPSPQQVWQRFLLSIADGELAHVSSSLIKQIASVASDEELSRFLPRNVVAAVRAKLGH